MAAYYVYILASRRRGTLYVGVTNDLARRAEDHLHATKPSFTATFGTARLVHVEVFEEPGAAIHREKQLKRWRRDWKIALIEAHNPDWAALRPDGD